MFQCLKCDAIFDETSSLARCPACGGEFVVRVEDAAVSGQRASWQNMQLIQDLKEFFITKIDTLPKRILLLGLVIATLVFLWPLYLGGILAFIIYRAEIEPSWLKFVLIALVLIIPFQISIERSKNLLGLNSPPEIVILKPTEEKITVKGVGSIEILGEIKPGRSTLEINGVEVKIGKDNKFATNLPISKGRNRIQLVGRHGSGETERNLEVFRALTDEETAEEERIQEEQKAKAEAKRKVQEEAKRKAEEEAQAREEKRISDLADTFCKTRSKAYSTYINLDDFSSMLEAAGETVTIHNVFNRAPSRASCKRIAEQCLKWWPEEDCKKMAEQKIWLGMAKNQLVLSWGLPRDQNDTVGSWGVHTQWVYGDFGPYVYLEGKSDENLVVRSWQD